MRWRINEGGFATQVIAEAFRRLGLDPGDRQRLRRRDRRRPSPRGLGVRLVLGLLRRLEDADLRRGLATLCIGVGQGMALTVERV